MKNLLFLFALLSGTIEAQEFEKHRWKHRLLVIYATEINGAEVQEQIDLLRVGKEELKARKVKVYVFAEDKIWVDFSSESQPNALKRMPSKPFEIVLIGLDGGEKYRSDEVQQVLKFNELIDSMPMRQQELKNKNKE